MSNFINFSSKELLALANGRSKNKLAAETEIARRVDARHLKGKHVSAALQKVANRVADRAVKAEAAQVLHEVAAGIDAGTLRWDGDVLVSA